MKVETIERNIQRSDSFEERSMGLAVGSEAFVFNVLRKDLYSDPIGSLIREYTVNAQDEHRKHGKSDVPIAIKVPSVFSPELHIRDFAGGLTEEQVFEFFGNYGASDKRDSNVAVGFFGLGCKSAFAYTDSYIVKSFKDGTVFTFNIYIDETEIGRVAKIAEEKTTEPNGVQVIVPVKTNNVSDFVSKVISTVRHFKTKPILEGLAEQPDFSEKTPLIEGEGWQFFKNLEGRGNGRTKVIMGEIAYPVSPNEFGYGEIENWERSLLQSELHLFAEIGDVQVTASREALQMSPKTKTAIRERLKVVKAEMLKKTHEAFAEAKTLIEAKNLYYSAIYQGGGYGNIIRESNDKILWNGEEIKDSYIKFGEYSPHRVSVYTTNHRGNITLSTEHSLYCDGNTEIYFDDTDKVKVNYRRRARTLLQDRDENGKRKTIRVIHTSNVEELESIIKCSVSELKSYKAIEPTALLSMARGGTGIDKSKRAKHASKMFQLNIAKLGSYTSAASENWEIKEVEDTKDLVYIPINRFQPTLPYISSLGTLREVLDNLIELGIDANIPIYGIKDGQDVSGMIRFDKWMEKKLDSATKLKNEYSLVTALGEYNLFNADYMNPKVLPEGLPKEYVSLYKEAKRVHAKPIRNTMLKMFRLTSLKIEPTKKLSELSEAFVEKYPILPLIDAYEMDKPQVLAYIEEREAIN